MLCFCTIEKVNAAEACRKILEVYGKNTMSERTTQEWFARFRSGNQDVKDSSCPGRPITEKVGEILQLVEQDRHARCQEITKALNINHMTVWNYLKKSNYKNKFAVWVPHELTQGNLNDRYTISEMLLKRYEIELFLKRIITGDEKWVKYENIKRKRSWSKAGDPPQSISKPGLTKNKVLLSVWWDWKGIVHYDLLQSLNEAIQK